MGKRCPTCGRMGPKGSTAPCEPWEIAEMARLYLKENMTLRQVSRLTGREYSTVAKALKRHGVKLRPTAAARSKEAAKRREAERLAMKQRGVEPRQPSL